MVATSMPPQPMPLTRINLNREAQEMLRSLALCMALLQHIVGYIVKV